MNRVQQALNFLDAWLRTHLPELPWIGTFRYGRLVLLAILVLTVAVSVKLAVTRARRGAGARVIRREARRALRLGNPLRAGQLYESVQDLEGALEAYRTASAFRPAALLCERMRRWEEAAQYYESAKEPERAAQMHQKQGNYGRAAELYLRNRKETEAAEMYEKGRDPGSAAALYLKAGQIRRAAVLFERAGQWGRAAELYERVSREARAHAEAGKIEEARTLGRQGARLYLKAGDPIRAAELFAAAGASAEAAEAYLAGGQPEKAAEVLLKAGHAERAAELYEKLGNHQRYCEVLAEARLAQGDRLAAARMFEEGEDFRRAAETCEAAGDLRHAADLYLKVKEAGHAADLYLRAGERASAATALEAAGRRGEAAALLQQLGEHARSAELYASCGDYFRAAEILAAQGEKERTIELLQKVDSSSPDYAAASLSLARLLMEKGMVSAARERYQRLVHDLPDGENRWTAMYELAQLHEKEKEFEQAVALYDRILAGDIAYKDVRPRAEAIRKALAEVKKAAPRPASAPEPVASGRYKLLRKVGQGGMGVVYRAEDQVLHRAVAYKVLPPSVKENPKILEQFLQEARVAAAINHPNIVTIYDTGRNGEDLFITMEFVEGHSLKEIVDQRGAIPFIDFLPLALQICEGVAFAHSRKVIHRDIKPANIMVTSDGTVKIMDFGLAKLITQAMEDKTTVKGTPSYMAPEQILGEKVDHQSDIYSLGCTFFRVLTGRLPFTTGDIYYHHLHTPPPAPRSVKPDLPAELDRILLKSLEKDKARRYTQVTELAKDLSAIRRAEGEQ